MWANEEVAKRGGNGQERRAKEADTTHMQVCPADITTVLKTFTSASAVAPNVYTNRSIAQQHVKKYLNTL